MKVLRFLDSQQAIGFGAEQPDGTVHRIEGDIFGEFRVTDSVVEIAKRLSPVQPTDVLCIGLNYRRHAEEGKQAIPTNPVLFMKTSSSVQNPNDPIVLPRQLRSDSVDYECELAIVIGRRCQNVTRDEALDYVLGYTCANDVSARDWQRGGGGGQWCRGKTFATFMPLGPVLVTKDEIPDPNQLPIKTILNGQVMQDWNTNDMIFDVPTLIAFLSGSTLLLPGTVILTGTPHGVGFARNPPVYLQHGDSVSVVIDAIGTLTNQVIDESIDPVRALEFRCG